MAMLQSAALISKAFTYLERIADTLDLILEGLDTQVDQIAVTDVAPQPGLQKDFPTPGSQRWIIDRTPDGRNVELVGAEDTEILPANVNRLGGSLVNIGEKDVTLYLARISQKNAGTATITLKAGGGSWDFRLGNLLWCGTVTARAAAGGSILSITEV